MDGQEVALEHHCICNTDISDFASIISKCDLAVLWILSACFTQRVNRQTMFRSTPNHESDRSHNQRDMKSVPCVFRFVQQSVSYFYDASLAQASRFPPISSCSCSLFKLLLETTSFPEHLASSRYRIFCLKTMIRDIPSDTILQQYLRCI